MPKGQWGGRFGQSTVPTEKKWDTRGLEKAERMLLVCWNCGLTYAVSIGEHESDWRCDSKGCKMHYI